MLKRNKRLAALGWLFCGVTVGLCGSGLVALAHDHIVSGIIIMGTMMFTSILTFAVLDRVRDTRPLGGKDDELYL